jgi:hypothetical protein
MVSNKLLTLEIRGSEWIDEGLAWLSERLIGPSTVLFVRRDVDGEDETICL